MTSPNTTRSALEVTTDFLVVNRIGTVLTQSRCLDLAKERARELSSKHEGVEVLEVTTTVQRRRVFRPSLRVVA